MACCRSDETTVVENKTVRQIMREAREIGAPIKHMRDGGVYYVDRKGVKHIARYAMGMLRERVVWR